MENIEKVRGFLRQEGYDPDSAGLDGDLVQALELDGARTVALMEAFGAAFKVNLREYHWYLHMTPTPPFGREDYLPTTIRDMAKTLETGKWPVPETVIAEENGWQPSRNQIVVAVVVLLLILARVYLLLR